MDFQETLNKKWRIELLRICILLAAIGTVTEIAIYLYDSAHNTLFLPLPLYRARFIYIPSSLNIIVILATVWVLNSARLSNRFKNTCACLLIYFLCANTQVIHYVYGPLLMLPTVAIFVSILFADKALTLGISIASLCSLGLAARQASIELRKGDPQLLTDILLAALVICISYIAAALLIRYVAEQIQYILKSNTQQKQLIEESNLDPLMGIRNRRALNQQLPKIIEGSSHAKSKHLLMLDLDDFKQINDTFGHAAGDEVLVQLATCIKQLRASDHVNAYRYGGEELVLVLEEMDKESAYMLCERLREAFSECRYSFAPSLQITFSGGFVTREGNVSAKEWIQKADSALYRAKAQGKNRILWG